MVGHTRLTPTLSGRSPDAGRTRERMADRWNRRTSPRIPTDLPLEGRTLERRLRGRIINLSARGLAMESQHTFVRGDRMSLVFLLPGDREPIRCIGEVVAAHMSVRGPTYSVRFQVIRPPQRLHLERYIAQQLRSQVSGTPDGEEIDLDDTDLVEG